MNRSLEQVIALLDASGKEALGKATGQALDKAAEFTVKAASNALVSALLGPYGTFASKFVEIFLQGLFNSQQNLQKIETAVSALVREPLMTGVEQLKLANKTVPSSKEAAQYRIERFRMALASLDRARSLASEKESKFEIAFVDLLRGFCALELSGGASEAISHLTAFLTWAGEEVAHLPSIMKKQQEIKEWDNVHSLDGSPDGSGMLSLRILGLEKIEGLRAEIERLTLQKEKIQDLLAEIDSPALEKERIRSLLAEIDELTPQKARLLNVVSYVSVLLQAAKRMANDAEPKITDNDV